MKKTSEKLLKLNKPKYEEHEEIPGLFKRLKKDYTKQSVLSSYDHYEVDVEQLRSVSKGNEKLINETLEQLMDHQNDERYASGFLGIKVFYSNKVDALGEKSEWIHVVFNHGHNVTLLAGRLGHPDWTYKQVMNKSTLYSMATMMVNG